MPPAVAQAPIVTRNRDCARTARMRSRSAAVVIDPSTSDRSYGPAVIVSDNSTKWEISTASDSASNSSSQSSNVS